MMKLQERVRRCVFVCVRDEERERERERERMEESESWKVLFEFLIENFPKIF
jgi:hypothetical protein